MSIISSKWCNISVSHSRLKPHDAGIGCFLCYTFCESEASALLLLLYNAIYKPSAVEQFLEL
jgi:hypothetical protein